MTKKIVILLCALSLLIFLGCGVNANAGTKYSPNIVEIDHSIMDSYYYAIDANTGVVYLSYDAYYRHSMTVMLNADGTPVTAEQLGLEYYCQ